MARHHLGDARVQAAVTELVDLFLREGTVRGVAAALQEALEQAGNDRKVYPNRIHTLLGGDPTRTVNTGSLEAVEAALTLIGPAKPSAVVDRRAAEVRGLLATTGAAPDRIDQVATRLGFPTGVVGFMAGHGPTELPSARAATTVRASTAPDWSWQRDAVAACVRSLESAPGRKAGLVVPTGGGKTRIALSVGLQLLAAAEDDDSEILWVTHRRHLHRQARRALQQLLHQEDGLPPDAASLFAHRFRFAMLRDLPEQMAANRAALRLVIVDEGHHAAAPSYQPLFEAVPTPRVLFLTATPNRADGLPIGIDEVAYTITYRELFERGCIVEPIFDPPLTMDSLDWSTPDGLNDLADFLLERTEDDLSKVLVVVSRVDRAETLYNAIADLHDGRLDHSLSADDIGFCHGSRSSAGSDPDAFLDSFAARPSGLLVATSQLIGEGFDDSAIDGVVLTYPSNSISHLMQVAGRALRYAPGKDTAHIIQVRNSALEYHFEQRWLYQDISDRLRPELVDLGYESAEALRRLVAEVLHDHRVPEKVRVRVVWELDRVRSGETVRLMLAGLPYYDDPGHFADRAEWQAILVTARDHERFRRIFNLVSDRGVGTHDPVTFLGQFVEVDRRAGSNWKSYVDLVEAMDHARKEIDGTPFPGSKARRYELGQATTWLRYVTLTYSPALPSELQEFLADAVNRTEVATEYLTSPETWSLAVRVRQPLGAFEAFLLRHDEASWLTERREEVIRKLREAAPLDAYATLAAWRSSLATVKAPIRLLDRMEYFLREDLFEAHTLDLTGLQTNDYGHPHPDGKVRSPDAGQADEPRRATDEEADDGDAV